MDYGLTQLSVYTDHKKEAYLPCEIRSNSPNGLTHVASKLNSNTLGIKRFDSGIYISFKHKYHIIMLKEYNLNPGRSELNTTLSEPNRSIMLAWNWYKRFAKITTKNSSTSREGKSPTKLQNKSFQVVDWRKTGHEMHLIGNGGFRDLECSNFHVSLRKQRRRKNHLMKMKLGTNIISFLYFKIIQLVSWCFVCSL